MGEWKKLKKVGRILFSVLKFLFGLIVLVGIFFLAMLISFDTDYYSDSDRTEKVTYWEWVTHIGRPNLILYPKNRKLNNIERKDSIPYFMSSVIAGLAGVALYRVLFIKSEPSKSRSRYRQPVQDYSSY